MRTRWICLFSWVVLLFAVVGAHAVYYDFSVEDYPMIMVGSDSTNAQFYSFFNIANLNLSFNINDDVAFGVRVKDTYFALTGTNKIYLDRANFRYDSKMLSIKAGRDIFAEGDGMVIGNLADGLLLRTSFLKFNQKIYAYYSGLLPNDVNQFNANSFDQANGADRFNVGLVLEKYGWGLKSMSITALYSMDTSTNQTFNPFYLAFDGSGSIGKVFSYGLGFAYQMGSLNSVTNLAAYALNVKALFLLGKYQRFGLLAKFSLASGDDPTDVGFQRFKTFGVYNTGFVLVPEFSNIYIVQLSMVARNRMDTFAFGVNVLLLNRLTSDTLNGFYGGAENNIGNELSLNLVWNLDPNISFFAKAGYLMVGKAFADGTPDIPKVLSGLIIKL